MKEPVNCIRHTIKDLFTELKCGALYFAFVFFLSSFRCFAAISFTPYSIAFVRHKARELQNQRATRTEPHAKPILSLHDYFFTASLHHFALLCFILRASARSFLQTCRSSASLSFDPHFSESNEKVTAAGNCVSVCTHFSFVVGAFVCRQTGNC